MRCKQELGGSENPLDEAVLEFNAKIVGRAGAGDWLNALPSKALGLHLRNREFILALRYRLELTVIQAPGFPPSPTLLTLLLPSQCCDIGQEVSGEQRSFSSSF